MESVGIYLLDPATGQQFQFPVNPSTLDIGGESLWDTVEIHMLGEVDFPYGNKRTTIRWSSFFPGAYDPHYCATAVIPDPLEAVDLLVNWRVQQKVLRLIVSGTHRGQRRDIINAPVIMPVFNPQHRGGEPNDVYYEIQLRQHREVKIRTAPEANSTAPQRLDLVPVPYRYVIQPGDTLYMIARRQLGSGDRADELYSLNRDAIGPDRFSLTPGTVLTLPGAGSPPSDSAPAPPPATESPTVTAAMGESRYRGIRIAPS